MTDCEKCIFNDKLIDEFVNENDELRLEQNHLNERIDALEYIAEEYKDALDDIREITRNTLK